MRPFQRRTAFEVSFPGEDIITDEQFDSLTLSNNSSNHDGKRKIVPNSPPRPLKRHRTADRPRACHYAPRPNEILESENLMVVGEDMDAVGYNADDKPVRILSSFCFFDSKRDMEMVSLSAMDDHDGIDWSFEGAGIVTPFQLDDDDDTQPGDIKGDKPFIRFKSIMRYNIDYSKKDDPVYIETPHAFYILSSPSHLYKPFFLPFYTIHRIAQFAVVSASSHPRRDRKTFLKELLATKDNLLAGKFSQDDLDNAIPVIKRAVEEQNDADKLISVPFIRDLLHDAGPVTTLGLSRNRKLRRALPVLLKGSLDVAVLRPERQTQTRVTPLIGSLASGLFQEQLKIVGSEPSPPSEEAVMKQRKQEQQAATRLRRLIEKALRPRKTVVFKVEERRHRFPQSVTIDGELFEIGDIVIMPIGHGGKEKPPDLPDPRQIQSTATIQEYFWFAKIIYINREYETAHVQWFWHSSTTPLQELSNPQELFLAELCDTIDLRCVTGKAIVHDTNPSTSTLNINHGEFFYKFTYDSVPSTYTDIDREGIKIANCNAPPDNCPVCLLVSGKDYQSFGQKLPTGVAYHGVNFHIYDFALIRANKGPCHIGYIIDINFPGKSQRHLPITIVVKLLGRVSSLAGILPRDIVKDERHLFMTDEEVKIKLEDLIRVCYVFPYSTIDDLDYWTALSADHFYVQYRFPSLSVSSWNDKQPINPDMYVCVDCCRDKLEQMKLMREFLAMGHRKPLPALDLFAGVGALGLGMEESGCIKVTHAIEIAPSAARTFKRNSPDTIVYNCCVNDVLEYAIKKERLKGQEIEPPKDVYDNTPIPLPPLPGMIEVLLAGFPCQSHSDLNMFRKADDPKSSLILPALAWTDFLRPKLCIFENVRGFLRYNIGARQAGKHRVEGGIEMGGLKLILHALISMDYQVRFGVLQAGHYGTPQTRIRFFLIAAVSGCPLPELPQPDHDFPVVDALQIKLPNGDSIRPIRTASGTAPHPFVTIDDAISDLPRFDWKNPGHHWGSADQQQASRDREKTIPALTCKQPAPYCGYEGVVPYYHEAKTTYQVRSRKADTCNLQHYTRCLIKAKVERVVNIPLSPKEDYRSLRPDLFDWQLANPSSAVAKRGFRPGFYGRLDKDGWFSTTVTNMDPTAKQSKVLNPYCKRILTVRELARSQGFPDHFVFESINNNVVTIHRQIGNAVPWLVSVALGKEIRESLFKKWLSVQGGASGGDGT